jgi:hypothetical protein
MDSLHGSVSNSLPQGLPIGLGHVGGVGATSFFESNNGEIATSFDSNAAASMLASPGPVPACDARSVSPDASSISDTQGSDQDTDSSSPDTGQFVGYKCDYPGCTRKKPFRLPSQLRYFSLPSFPFPCSLQQFSSIIIPLDFRSTIQLTPHPLKQQASKQPHPAWEV